MKYTEQKIKYGVYGGFGEDTFKYPEDLVFWVNEGEIGNVLCKDCQHYYTIFPKGTYPQFEESLKTPNLFVNVSEIANYWIIECRNVSNETKLPIISREKLFKIYNVDFSNYTFVNFNRDGDIVSAFRIKEFYSVYRIEGVECIIKSWINEKDMFLVNGQAIETCNSSYFEKIILTKPVYSKTLLNDCGGNIVWNTMLHKIFNKVDYNSVFVEDIGLFDTDRKMVLKEFKNILEKN